jgi:hypothetical protein
MLTLLTSLLTGPLIASIMGVVGKYIDKQANKDILQAEIEKAVLGTIKDVSSTQADVIKAEMQSESWLARNWRPISALCFVAVVIFYALWVPITVAYFGWTSPRIGDPLLLETIGLVKICLGGYIGFRSLEKITETVFSRWRR